MVGPVDLARSDELEQLQRLCSKLREAAVAYQSVLDEVYASLVTLGVDLEA
jgi:hypothetical protein